MKRGLWKSNLYCDYRWWVLFHTINPTCACSTKYFTSFTTDGGGFKDSQMYAVWSCGLVSRDTYNFFIVSNTLKKTELNWIPLQFWRMFLAHFANVSRKLHDLSVLLKHFNKQTRNLDRKIIMNAMTKPTSIWTGLLTCRMSCLAIGNVTWSFNLERFNNQTWHFDRKVIMTNPTSIWADLLRSKMSYQFITVR